MYATLGCIILLRHQNPPQFSASWDLESVSSAENLCEIDLILFCVSECGNNIRNSDFRNYDFYISFFKQQQITESQSKVYTSFPVNYLYLLCTGICCTWLQSQEAVLLCKVMEKVGENRQSGLCPKGHKHIHEPRLNVVWRKCWLLQGICSTVCYSSRTPRANPHNSLSQLYKPILSINNSLPFCLSAANQICQRCQRHFLLFMYLSCNMIRILVQRNT